MEPEDPSFLSRGKRPDAQTENRPLPVTGGHEAGSDWPI